MFLTNVKRGIHIPNWAIVTQTELRGYKSKGYDHTRAVVRGTPQWPGGGLPPTIKLDVDFSPFVKLCNSKQVRLKTIVATESHSQMNTRLFYDILNNNNCTLFDNYLLECAGKLARLNPDMVAWEIFPEPGWFMRDTQAYVYNTFPQSEWYLYNHPWQRLFAAKLLETWLDHIIPLVRQIAPNIHILLPSTGWGSPTGPGDYQDLNPGRFTNVSQRFHFYAPRELTHRVPPFNPAITWPNPLLKGNYEFDFLYWNKDSLNKVFVDAKAFCDKHSVPVFFDECGCIGANRNTPESQAYIADIRAVAAENNVPITEWNDPIPLA